MYAYNPEAQGQCSVMIFKLEAEAQDQPWAAASHTEHELGYMSKARLPPQIKQFSVCHVQKIL